MFEFILCINWKSVLWCPWNLLYCCPWLVKFVKWRCKRRYTSKTWYQKLKKTQIILLLLVCWLSVTPFGVWVCECACMESRRNTECTCNFARRPDGDSIFFTGVFFFFCANSLEFSCLLWQPVINFFAATVKHVGAEAGPVQNPAGFHNENIMNFKRPNFDSRRQENRLEALRTFKKKCGYIFKRSLVNRFRTKENVFWYKISSVLQAKRSTTA